jgi:hypothetical protein
VDDVFFGEEQASWVPALPEPYKDGIYSDIEIRLGWRERLHALIDGIVYVNVRTLVEHSPGKMETETRVKVSRWFWPWAKRLELGTVERE